MLTPKTAPILAPTKTMILSSVKPGNYEVTWQRLLARPTTPLTLILTATPTLAPTPTLTPIATPTVSSSHPDEQPSEEAGPGGQSASVSSCPCQGDLQAPVDPAAPVNLAVRQQLSSSAAGPPDCLHKPVRVSRGFTRPLDWRCHPKNSGFIHSNGLFPMCSGKW